LIAPPSVILPYEDSNATLAIAQARRALAQTDDVILFGARPLTPPASGFRVVTDARGSGAALRAGVPLLRGPVTVVQPPEIEVKDYAALVADIYSDKVDVVVGRPSSVSDGILAAAVSRLGRMLAGLSGEAAIPGVTALRTSVLQSLGLVSDDERFETELRVKLGARRFRFAEAQSGLRAVGRPSPRLVARAKAYLRYGLLANDADNIHDGYNTLARMDEAPHYNAWLGRRMRSHLGPRVLEIGAGIGTITRELLVGRELIIALEADAFYVERLRNVFRDEPRVRPIHAPVEATDWDGLAKEHLNSVVLSNVLEHIEDDALAIRQFRRVLNPGGTLVIFVPALPALYGTIDRAIGHFRRYTPETLRKVIEAGGFRIENLEWMNILGIPGWFLNNRVFKRRSVPPLQLRVYDRIAPVLARTESAFKIPIGMSLLAVARAV
jgi:SAM-dependent methyltransferase